MKIEMRMTFSTRTKTSPVCSSSRARLARNAGSRKTRCFLTHETSGSEVTAMSPVGIFSSGAWSGPGLRTATAQVETPRIMTPSSTACPPTGASLTASRLGRGGASVLTWSRLAFRPALRAGEQLRVVVLQRLADRVARIRGHAHGVSADGPSEGQGARLARGQMVEGDRVEDGLVDAQRDLERVSDDLAGVSHRYAVAAGVGCRPGLDAQVAHGQVRKRPAAHLGVSRCAVEHRARGRQPAVLHARLVGSADPQRVDGLLPAEALHARLRCAPLAQRRHVEPRPAV